MQTMMESTENLLHKGDEGHNSPRGMLKMSFTMGMKDITRLEKDNNVLHRGDEGHNSTSKR
jgi:hypothetical protein